MAYENVRYVSIISILPPCFQNQSVIHLLSEKKTKVNLRRLLEVLTFKETMNRVYRFHCDFAGTSIILRNFLHHIYVYAAKNCGCAFLPEKAIYKDLIGRATDKCLCSTFILIMGFYETYLTRRHRTSTDNLRDRQILPVIKFISYQLHPLWVYIEIRAQSMILILKSFS